MGPCSTLPKLSDRALSAIEPAKAFQVNRKISNRKRV